MINQKKPANLKLQLCKDIGIVKDISDFFGMWVGNGWQLGLTFTNTGFLCPCLNMSINYTCFIKINILTPKKVCTIIADQLCCKIIISIVFFSYFLSLNTFQTSLTAVMSHSIEALACTHLQNVFKSNRDCTNQKQSRYWIM